VPKFKEGFLYVIPDTMTIAVTISSMSLLQNGLDHCIAALNNQGVDGRTVYVIIVSSQMLADFPMKIKELQPIIQKKCRPKYKRGAEILFMADYFGGLIYFDGDKEDLNFPAENMAKSFVLRALNGSNGYVKGGLPDLKGFKKQDNESEEVFTEGKYPIEECEVSLKPEYRRARFTTVQLLMYLHKFFLEAEYEANPSQFTFDDNKSIFMANGEIRTTEEFRTGTSELMGCIPNELRFVEVMKERLFSGRSESKAYKIPDSALKKIFKVVRKKEQQSTANNTATDREKTTAAEPAGTDLRQGETKEKSTDENDNESSEKETPIKRKRSEQGATEANSPTETTSPNAKKIRKAMEAREKEKIFLETIKEDLLTLQRMQGDQNENRRKRSKRARGNGTDEEKNEYNKAVEDLLEKVAKRQEEVIDLTLEDDSSSGNDDNEKVDDDDDNEDDDDGDEGGELI